ncbi:MAG: precorrin-2 C(20)-methyltransferase [Pseudomonadota bacterium]
MSTNSGTLWGLGVGPGDPELMTLKAVRLLQASPVVAYFCRRGGPGQARAIAEAHVPASATELALTYPVTTELPHDSPEYRERIEAFFDQAAEEVAAHLAAGQDVAALNEGDPFYYGSFMHLQLRLQGRHPVAVVPGVTSTQAAAAGLPRPLVMRDDALHVIPGTLPTERLRAALTEGDAVAIMKVGTNLPRIAELLDELALTSRAWYVESASGAGERILPLAEVAREKAPYFSQILIPGEGVRR